MNNSTGEKEKRECNLQNVLHDPKFSYQVLCAEVIDDMGLHTTFDKKYCQIIKGTLVMTEETFENSLHILRLSSNSEPKSSKIKAMVTDLNLWGQKLAHVYGKGIHSIVRSQVTHGIFEDMWKRLKICPGSFYGQITRASIFQQEGLCSSEALDRVYTDVCAPFQKPSLKSLGIFCHFSMTV